MEIKDTVKTLASGGVNAIESKIKSLETPVRAEPSLAVTTSKSAELKAIEAMAGSAPTFDAAKVASIKSAIEAGTFKTNPGDVADGLILSAQDFLSTALKINDSAAANK
jgi:negative regulator of flagellin synthesis FlgM